MKSVFEGFKNFILRGNAIELAVGVVIGAAFNAVVTSLVDNLVNPIVGAIFGKPDFNDLWDITLRHNVDAEGNDATIHVGSLLTALVQFLIVAAAVYFVIVLPMNKLNERIAQGKTPDPEPKPENIQLLTEIRDLLARGNGNGDGTTGTAGSGGPAGTAPGGAGTAGSVPPRTTQG